MHLDPKQVGKMRPFPPLGTLYAATALRESGYSVALFDAMLAADERAFAAALDRHVPRMVALVEDHFNFLSKMCLERMRQALLWMIRRCDARGLPVVVSASDATDRPELHLQAGAAAVIVGEPEHSLRELAAGILVGRVEDLAGIDGLVLAGEPGAPIRSPARAQERQPDRFGPPDRDLVDMAAYRRLWRAAHGEFVLNIVSTRGCPFHCNWCAKPVFGQRYAMRGAAAVAAEMAELKHRYAPDRLWFADDIFGLRPDWVAEFAAEVQAREAEIPFQIQTRADLIDPAVARQLREAGCDEAWLGVESGAQTVLDAMDKGLRIQQIEAASAALRSAGIRRGFFIQLGYPGETWPEIEATAELLRRLDPDEIGVSVSYPLPGTRFFDRVAAQLGQQRNWRDSQHLAMLFGGHYEGDFYRRLHAQLHREQDARRALRQASHGAEASAARQALERTRQDWQALAEDAPSWERPSERLQAGLPIELQA